MEYQSKKQDQIINAAFVVGIAASLSLIALFAVPLSALAMTSTYSTTACSGSGTVSCPAGTYIINATDSGFGSNHGINPINFVTNSCTAWEGVGNGGACGCTITCVSSSLPPICPNFGLERTTVYDLQGVSYSYGYGVATDSAKNVYVTGEQYAPASGLDMYVIKYDGNGAMQWEKTYDNAVFGVTGTESGNESGYGIAVVGNSVYVVGRQTDPSGLFSDIFVRKYDDTGALLWSKIYDGGATDIARGAAADAAGNVYVAGYRQNAGGDIDMLLLSYDANGNLRAGFPIANGGAGTNESAFGITVSGSDVYITGYVQPSVNNTDMALWKYNTSGGLAWTQTYNSGANQTDIGYGVNVSAINDVYVTGYQETNGGDMVVRKYTSAGGFVWSEPYNSGGNQNDVGRGVATGNSNRIFIAGRQQTNNEDAFLNEYEKDGYASSTTSTVYATPGTGGVQSGSVTGPSQCGGDPASNTQYMCSWTAGAYCQTPSGINTPAAGNCSASVPLGQAGSTSWYNGDAGPPTVFPCLPGYTLVGSMCQKTTTTSFITYLLNRYLYKGDQGGAPEYAEIGYGIAQTDSSVPAYVGKANDVYVTGYSGESGGQMFLNKYGCNATSVPTFGSSTAANFTVTPPVGTAPLDVKVDARATAGSIVSYSWDWGDSTTKNNATPIETHTYASAGTYVITLTVKDTKGATSSVTGPVTVSPNTAPTASFIVTPATGSAPLLVTADGAGSSDPDAGGYVKSFTWDWGDKTVAGSGQKTTHTYTAQGTYTITLTVTDNGGMTNTATQIVTVTSQYVCAAGCTPPTSVCGPGPTIGTTQCYACLTSDDCGTGYKCLGTTCKQGTTCADGTLCPADGVCKEALTCNPLASGATCPDGTACPANGVCPAMKYTCVLSSAATDAQCYVEGLGSCLIDADCKASITGGVCDTATNTCQYAKCVNTTDFACTKDSQCANGDGTCNAGVCNYVYDCGYGPGMKKGASGLYATSTADAMPKMPQGVQPNGEACTKPTPDAPNNCEGINGCLYYNYNSDGTPIVNSNNSVGNCVNMFEGGTGCVYYQYYDGTTQTTKTNCLPRYSQNTKKSPQAGIPTGCFVNDKGKAGKEYDCSAVDGCYYYLDGRVDCRYVNKTAETCTTSATCTTQPLATGVCNGATNLCEYQGNGCIYESNPKGAISCPGVSKVATGGQNFVQCLLDKDAALPGFLLGAGGAPLSACKVNADCPTGDICVNGTCYPQCQANVDCASGQACTTTCSTSLDCAGSLTCNAGVCVPPTTCTPGTICPSGVICPVNGVCPPPPGCVPGTICPTGVICPVNGVCPGVSACLNGKPTGSLSTGTTQTTISLDTNSPSSCSYSLIATDPYPLMTPFTTTGLVSHSTLVTGLLSGVNTYYVKCADGSGTVTNACSISFGVGTSCTSSASCASGLMCIAGVCQPPVCSNASPTGALPPGTISTTIGLTTSTASNCRYSANVSDTYAMMTSFATSGGTTHTTLVSGLVNGGNTQYVRCQDAVTSLEKLCQIPFSVGVCSQQYKCDTGFMCVPNTGTGVCVPVGCIPGTTCASGTTCTASGVCPPASCTPGTTCAIGTTCTTAGTCPCPPGTTYNAASGLCENCSTNSLLPGCPGFSSWCILHPTDPLCKTPGPGLTITPGTASCNTLGYTFTGTAVTPSGNCDLVAIILALLSWMAWIIALLAVLSGLRAGYLYITAMGDDRRLILARRYLIYTTIGVAVSVLSFSIVAIARAVFNI